MLRDKTTFKMSTIYIKGLSAAIDEMIHKNEHTHNSVVLLQISVLIGLKKRLFNLEHFPTEKPKIMLSQPEALAFHSAYKAGNIRSNFVTDEVFTTIDRKL